MNSTVGIVIPAYNDYIVSQKTWETLRAYPLWTIVRQGHTLGECRNIGIGRTDTDYILTLDGDDYLCDGTVEKWQQALDKHPSIDVVYSDHYSLKDGVLTPWIAEPWTLKHICNGNLYTACIMFRKDAWKKASGYGNMPSYEDWEFIARLYRAGCKGMKVEGMYGFVHVQHGDNMFQRMNKEYGEERLKAMLKERVPEVFGGCDV